MIPPLYKSTRATMAGGVFVPRSYFFPDEAGPYYIHGEELRTSPPGVRVRAVPCKDLDGEARPKPAQRSLF